MNLGSIFICFFGVCVEGPEIHIDLMARVPNFNLWGIYQNKGKAYVNIYFEFLKKEKGSPLSESLVVSK